MANNCLITKLKSVVNNDNLVKLGEMVFVLAPNQVTSAQKLAFSSPTTIYVHGTAEIWDASNTNRIDDGEKLVVNSYEYVLFKGGTDGGKVTVENKYAYTALYFGSAPTEQLSSIVKWYSGSYTSVNLVNFFGQNITKPLVGKSIQNLTATGVSDNTNVDGDLADFSEIKNNLINVIINNTNIKGDISNVAGTSLVTLNAPDCPLLSGDIAVLGACLSIENINLAYSDNITGTRDDYAQAAVAAGRTSGQVSVRLGENMVKVVKFGAQYPGGYTIVDN